MSDVMKTLICSMVLVAVGAGCQSSHKPAPIARTHATTQSDLSSATAPSEPVTPPATRIATVAPATIPVATRAVAVSLGNYVAADADEATRARNWPVSVNYYPSGHGIAGPVYRIIPPHPRSNKLDDIYVSEFFASMLTIPQMLATPFWAIYTRPNTPVEYHGDTIPPSYNVDRPLPYYENENVPGMFDMTRWRNTYNNGKNGN